MAFINPEFTLAKLSIKLMVSQSLKHDSEMLYMYVANEDHKKLVHVQHEYRVHEVHDVFWHICQPKRHDKILIKPVSLRERCLGDIFGMDFNLMITRVKINLGEHLGSC
jgi:hypothetical protein